jgi:hypothetical protein
MPGFRQYVSKIRSAHYLRMRERASQFSGSNGDIFRTPHSSRQMNCFLGLAINSILFSQPIRMFDYKREELKPDVSATCGVENVIKYALNFDIAVAFGMIQVSFKRYLCVSSKQNNYGIRFGRMINSSTFNHIVFQSCAEVLHL